MSRASRSLPTSEPPTVVVVSFDTHLRLSLNQLDHLSVACCKAQDGTRKQVNSSFMCTKHSHVFNKILSPSTWALLALIHTGEIINVLLCHHGIDAVHEHIMDALSFRGHGYLLASLWLLSSPAWSKLAAKQTWPSFRHRLSIICVRMPPDGVPNVLKTVNGLADVIREWRNCFLATASGLGFETSVLEPCFLVLRSSQQRYHGIIGLAVDDIAGGGDEVWEQAISKLMKRFTFGQWEVGKGEFLQSRGRASSRWIHARWTARLYQDFVPLGKLRKEQSAWKSTRPVGSVSILQSRFNRGQVSDTQETNRVVRLAKAHTNLALPVCKIPVDQICFVSLRRCQWWEHTC